MTTSGKSKGTSKSYVYAQYGSLTIPEMMTLLEAMHRTLVQYSITTPVIEGGTERERYIAGNLCKECGKTMDTGPVADDSCDDGFCVECRAADGDQECITAMHDSHLTRSSS